jgi:IS4 transposase
LLDEAVCNRLFTRSVGVAFDVHDWLYYGNTETPHVSRTDPDQRTDSVYRRRWGIETSYRQIGAFVPRTSSPTFSVRLFYFLFAVALYNLWVLANILVSAKRLPEKPLISPRIFRRLGVTNYS